MNDDGRFAALTHAHLLTSSRPISRAYVCSLTDRILLLETMLKEQGVEVPPANHPPTNRQLLRNGERLARRRSSKTHQLQHLCHNLESERRSPDDYIKAEHGDLENLECQSGTRDTESFVLQPSEKECMGIGEGTPEKDTLLFSSKSMLIPVPTRGRSTDEISGQPLSKRRRTSHPQASTNISKCRSISSISIASASNAGLLDGTCKMPLLQQNDTQHVDDFTSTTPCSETSNWHALREPAPGVEYGFTTPSSTNRSTPGPCSAWMGADSEAVHSISQVASLNLSAFPTLEDTRDISDIDFLSFGDGGDNWGRVWTAETTFADELGAGYFPEKTRNVAWGFGR